MATHFLWSRPAATHEPSLVLKESRGYTLIELVVSVAILAVITSMILVSNAKFGGKVQLQNLAYDIALSIRQAQVYGISVSGFGVSGVNNFNYAYGAHFDMTTPTSYVLFADKNPNGIFDASDQNVPPSPYTIGHGFYISKLCAPGYGGTVITIDNCTPVSKVDIVFKRPEPQAYIRANDSSTLLPSARIFVASPRGDSMSIQIGITGQISMWKP